MTLYYYRKHISEKLYYLHDCELQIMQFCKDVAKVYPGGVNGGVRKNILTLNDLEPHLQVINDIADFFTTIQSTTRKAFGG